MNDFGAASRGLHACALACALVCATLAGCIEEKCDPGYTSRRGACYPIPSDAGAPAPAGGRDADVDGGSDAALGCPRGEGFGVTCEVDDDCTCGTQCVPVLKICSVLNCESTPEVCPVDWQCQDISAASPNPSVSSICLAAP